MARPVMTMQVQVGEQVIERDVHFEIEAHTNQLNGSIEIDIRQVRRSILTAMAESLRDVANEIEGIRDGD